MFFRDSSENKITWRVSYQKNGSLEKIVYFFVKIPVNHELREEDKPRFDPLKWYATFSRESKLESSKIQVPLFSQDRKNRHQKRFFSTCLGEPGISRKKPFQRLEVPLITEVEKKTQMQGNDPIGDTSIFHDLTIMGGRVIMCWRYPPPTNSSEIIIFFIFMARAPELNKPSPRLHGR